MAKERAIVGIEVLPGSYDAVLAALETLEAAGVQLLRFPATEHWVASGPLFPIYGMSLDGPRGYVFFLGEKPSHG